MTFNARIASLLGLALFSVTLVGCADGGGGATSAVAAAENTVCPCMGGKIDGTTSVEWNGKTIGFCCPPCIDTWNEMSDEERTAALAENTAAADHSDHAPGDADEDHHAEHAEGSDHAEPAAGS